MTLLSLINQHIKLKMSLTNSATMQGDKTAVFTKIVDSFLVSEVKLAAIKKNIIKLLDEKIVLFESITGEKFDTSQKLYEMLNSIADALN